MNPETIRFYEREGLIPQPARPAEGYRLYPPSAVSQIRFLKQCQDLGFTLREARDLMHLADQGSRGCHEAGARVEAKIAELDQKIEKLRAMRESLLPLLGCKEGEACRVMETLTRAACAACALHSDEIGHTHGSR